MESHLAGAEKIAPRLFAHDYPDRCGKEPVKMRNRSTGMRDLSIASVDQPFHVAYGLFQTDHDRASDDAMADVQFAHLRDRSDWFDVAVRQAVS